VLGVYGAYRIDILQQDVAAARKIGQYVLGRQLGSGGMGEVYLAEHQFLRRPCAVKVIRPAHGDSPAALARFEREVQATAALTHPNTIQIYDYGHTDDGTFFYAMEYLPGESLDELVSRAGRVPPARAIHLLTQIAGSLREAHAQGLVHRDVKPSNVIVTERGGIPDFAKLLDFGLVATSGPIGDSKLTEVGMLIGTPAFRSPEQCGGEEQVGPASDIYSVGALGYFLLAGQAPFAGKTPMQMLAAHLYETPKPLSEHSVDVPAEVEALIARCLAKRPEDRFASAAELERALDELAVTRDGR
jgi:serine/threonine-protein kinase